MNKPAPISIEIPRFPDEIDDLTVDLAAGEPLFVVGANGSGKSALLQFIYKSNPDLKHRWLRAIRSNLIIDDRPQAVVSPETRQKVDRQVQQSLNAPNALWAPIMEPLPQQRTAYDLILKHKDQTYKFSRWANAQSEEISAEKLSIKARTIISDINDIFEQAAIPIEFEITSTDDLRAKQLGGDAYHIRQLSDGERNAVFLLSEALTVDQNSLLLIDEPEQHLHRSIIVPLLSTLFAKRSDCYFIVSTHELALPAANSGSKTIILRSCKYDDAVCKSWDADLFESNMGLPEELKIAILGSRRSILFVEGAEGKLDQSLYKLIYPDVSVIAVGGCGEVIRSVKGLGRITTFHRVSAFGLIDRDDRTPEKVEQLKTDSIFALDVHSAEALYYCLEARTAAAQAQTSVKDATADTLLDESKIAALEALAEESVAERLVTDRCLRLIRNSVEGKIPNKSDFVEKPNEEIKIEVKSPYDVEREKFKRLLAGNELDKLIARYPVRNSTALHALAKGLKFDNRDDYEQAVLLQIKSNSTLWNEILNKLSSLSEAIK